MAYHLTDDKLNLEDQSLTERIIFYIQIGNLLWYTIQHGAKDS
jgi:hypothetical protein